MANSRRNSYSGPGIKPQDIQIAIEQIEDKENEKNTAKRFVNGGNTEEIHASEYFLMDLFFFLDFDLLCFQ